MADQTDFKHITVNPAEEDDIVIHAGAASESAEPSGRSRGEACGGERRADAAHGDAGSRASSEGPNPKEGPASPSPKPDSYRQTTLEDIQGFKMSKTQIAVIVVALVAIAAFVVWYLVFS